MRFLYCVFEAKLSLEKIVVKIFVNFISSFLSSIQMTEIV